jgi:rhamnose utilization protein RhaD (predicted bifunctional aldolase and dehydrogenase)
MSLQELVSVSRRYGADPEYVVAGGGNTSFKDVDTLYIKGSGTALSTIEASGFVRMNRTVLAAVWKKAYSEDSDARESAVLADLMAARFPGEEAKRPSVETLLHDILPFAFVVHTHPALVNGLTCSAGGKKAMEELFGDEAIWIPSTNPGYILSKVVKDAMGVYSARRGASPSLIFLQNHGVFVGADTVAGIDALYRRVMGAIAARAKRKPALAGAVAEFGNSVAVAGELERIAAPAFGADVAVAFLRNAEFARLTESRTAFASVSSAFTPDHIVYAGSDPLFVEGAAALQQAWKTAVAEKGRAPKTVALQGIGVFGIGSGEKAARLALELFTDAAKVACYTEAFGGPRFMTRDQIDFINNWEVERYRSKISAGPTGSAAK